MWQNILFCQVAVECLMALQPLRAKGVCIAIMSRHYLPNSLSNYLKDTKSAINSSMFDIMISLYTGEETQMMIIKTSGHIRAGRIVS